MNQFIVAFDIGKKNFAFVVEDVGCGNADFFKNITNIPKAKRYHKAGEGAQGTPTDGFGATFARDTSLAQAACIKGVPGDNRFESPPLTSPPESSSVCTMSP